MVDQRKGRATLLIAVMLSVSQSWASDCYHDVSFNSYSSTHRYSVLDANKDFKKTTGPYKRLAGGNGGGSATVIEDGTIRGFFPKGKILGYDTGFTWYAMNSAQTTEASMSYRVKFSPGFDWKKGGKLPGLCGGEGAKGSACPVGCSFISKDRGFSTRLMWREGGAMVTYAYYPDKPRSIRCGEDWKWSKKLQAGRWHHIRMWMKLNSPGDKNGQFKAWLDGDEVFSKAGIRFRYKDSFKISRTYMTTYAGGSTVSLFAPKHDQYIWFDDVKVWSGSSQDGCGGSSSPAESKSPQPPPQPPNAETPKRGSTGPRGAHVNVSSYRLVYKDAGWDITGHFKRTKPSRGSLNDNIRDCAKDCDREAGCKAFTLHGDICWLKDIVKNKRPFFAGESQFGWRWFYLKNK